MNKPKSIAMDEWLARLFDRDRMALGRSITWVENQTAEGATVLKSIQKRLGRALVVGFTGPPGVGKSTLVSAYVRELRKSGKTIGVIAVDPSSPFSGGAILGDRIRMSEHTNDPDVFVRSVASRGQMGGLSLTTARIIDVMDAAGFDVVIVETVGAGQSEHEIAEVADTKVVITTPGYGDDVQAVKAGILEIADILLVNKSDLPLADQAAAQLEAMLHLSSWDGWKPPVLKTIATTGDGIPELTDAVENHGATVHDARKTGSVQRTKRLIASLASDHVKKHIARSDDAGLTEMCEAVARGEVDFNDAVDAAIRLCGREADA